MEEGKITAQEQTLFSSDLATPNPFDVFPVLENLIIDQMAAPISCKAAIDSVQVDVFVDSGAAVCIMGDEIVQLLRKTLEPYGGVAAKGVAGALIQANAKVTAKVLLAGCLQTVGFLVLSGYDKILIGNSYLIKTGLVIDHARRAVHRFQTQNGSSFVPWKASPLLVRDIVTIPSGHVAWVACEIKYSSVPNSIFSDGMEFLADPKQHIYARKGLRVANSLVKTVSNACYLSVANFTRVPQKLAKHENIALAWPVYTEHESSHKDVLTTTTDNQNCLPKLVTGTQLTWDQTCRLQELVARFRSCFPTADRPLGRITGVAHTVDTGDAKPISQAPYRRSWAERIVIRDEVDKMLKARIGAPSCSPWASFVVLEKERWVHKVLYRLSKS